MPFAAYLITTYKVIFCLLDVSSNFFVLHDNSITRRHLYKVMLEHCDDNSQKQFLPHRIAKVWNSLPAAATDFTNLTSCRTLTYAYSRVFRTSFFFSRAHVRDKGTVCPLNWLTISYCSYISVYSIQFNKHVCMYVCIN